MTKIGGGVGAAGRPLDAVGRGREGPADPLADLYLRHAPGAIGLAYVLTGDRAAAEDVAQEAFVRLVGRLGHLRDPAAFEGYLRRTVVNVYLTRLRRQRLERAFLERHRGRAATSEPPDVDARHSLWAVLRELPGRQRTAVVLRYYGDLSEAQVAEALRCSVPAAKSLIARGLATLRRRVPEDLR